MGPSHHSSLQQKYAFGRDADEDYQTSQELDLESCPKCLKWDEREDVEPEKESVGVMVSKKSEFTLAVFLSHL